MVAVVVVVMPAACLVEIVDPVTVDSVGAGGSGASAGAGASGGGTEVGGGTSVGGSGGGAQVCPPDMVHVTRSPPNPASFCIDRTEVTRTAYVQFLASVSGEVGQTEQPPECAFNTELTRTGAGSLCPNFSTGGDLPVNCVDWCDAYAFCAWAGKRLCGSTVDGAELTRGDVQLFDEWHVACNGGDEAQDYPYGPEPQLCACFLPEEWEVEMACGYENIGSLNEKAPVASHPDCEGGFPGIFDMQGNVSEWTARCDPGDGLGDELCVVRGGATRSVAGSSYFTCSNVAQAIPRSDNGLEPGIRCCKDAE